MTKIELAKQLAHVSNLCYEAAVVIKACEFDCNEHHTLKTYKIAKSQVTQATYTTRDLIEELLGGI